MPTAASTFTTESWKDEPYHDADGRKLTKTTAVYRYHGDQEGDGVAEYLMAHGPDGTHFVGLEHFKGRLGDHDGTFVLQHVGTFEDGVVRTRFFVVPGSGTGGLEGLRGEGVFEGGHAERYEVEWDYNFEEGQA